MRDYTQFYIDGHWADPSSKRISAVINPATEQVSGQIALGSEEDVNRAVAAARRAFPAWSKTSREDRVAILEQIVAEGEKRADDLVAAISEEMGAPEDWSRNLHYGYGSGHMKTAADILRTFSFEERQGNTVLRREPIGVCALITPWNWPLHELYVKIAPALATGCTLVLKPSELAPYSAYIVAEILHAAGVPAGVFNLVNGSGQEVGTALAKHPDVDMISVTGSVRAGSEVAIAAAPSIKRVHQELGGKGANIILDDERLPAGVAHGVHNLMSNAGQSCAAPSRMLVPASRMAEVIEIAAAEAAKVTVGAPHSGAEIGPVISESARQRIEDYIQSGIDEGAQLIAGGTGRPKGLEAGYYIRPTVFAHVARSMKIAREEIFGPVLVILGYEGEEEAIEIANDSDYGLSAFVWGEDLDRLRGIADRVRAGMIYLNEGNYDLRNPWGGYKKSGNGREQGEFAFHDFLEVKGVMYPG
ncbi:aldehyde dehydrogenase family protein [Rhizobium sp. YK2]|uniref:aldehyde dehydrogenase family protein n=1 Tax=Rhizobium sp. YK2 TaxID=1860096 RepID=UPI00084CC4EE|nr:aldehyde dehydrogenase family protein [Rhizobium sp. YK2]OED00737.1 aldehyde dehydrogenase [Rhizobium sp. YK2]